MAERMRVTSDMAGEYPLEFSGTRIRCPAVLTLVETTPAAMLLIVSLRSEVGSCAVWRFLSPALDCVSRSECLLPQPVMTTGLTGLGGSAGGRSRGPRRTPRGSHAPTGRTPSTGS